MHWKLRIIILSFIFSLCIVEGHAQSNKRYKGKRHTSKREIAKKQQDALDKQAAEAPYAPKKAFQTAAKDLRDDYIWKSQTAGIVYPKAGNISFYEPSKYAFSKRFQLESILPLDYHVPNLFGKYLWVKSGDWYFSSRHGIYSATTGFKYFQQREQYQWVDSSVSVPLLVSIKNELILSRAFTKPYGCSGPQPYLILTGSIGADYGLPINGDPISEINRHFVTNRSPALTGNGYTANLMLRADYQINQALYTGASLRYFYGNFTNRNAFEQKAWLETLLGSYFSLSVGYAFSWANYQTARPVSFIPTADVCFYFGRKIGHQAGLFGKKM